VKLYGFIGFFLDFNVPWEWHSFVVGKWCLRRGVNAVSQGHNVTQIVTLNEECCGH